ncbi:hypothetical protein [Roseomonas sp. KE0001]|uniref:hypothetical protein n=1 Tax=Roseomonas sp. KE0001 TaxID=2479201 RepID=UPI0018DF44A6|nr:hypothetical protein [Roseomonas sp. KE0001]MBI0435199.1 hypothetical protein [Roseomonas sp. KE0001]
MAPPPSIPARRRSRPPLTRSPAPAGRAALLGLALLLPPAASCRAAAGEEAATLPPPAAAAPAPPDLSRAPRPGVPLPRPDIALPRGIAPAPEGGWLVTGPAARGAPDAAAAAALAEIGRWLATATAGRVTLLAQVAGPVQDVSVARRDSLAHGLAIRAALERGGLDGTRIDTRPLGRTSEARDAILLIPPTLRAAPESPALQPSTTRP